MSRSFDIKIISRKKLLQVLASPIRMANNLAHFLWFQTEHRWPKIIVCILYGNFGSERFIRLCTGIYQVFQNGRICAEMLK